MFDFLVIVEQILASTRFCTPHKYVRQTQRLTLSHARFPNVLCGIQATPCAVARSDPSLLAPPIPAQGDTTLAMVDVMAIVWPARVMRRTSRVSPKISVS